MSKKRALSTPSIDTDDPSSREWPASNDAMSAAREFLQFCATFRLPTLLVPDKDADGLCGTMIVYRTLLALGLPRDRLHVHFVQKGSNVHKDDETACMEAYDARRVVVIDQGSRKSGPIVRGSRKDGEGAKTLIIDHHWSDTFPEEAIVLSAARHSPVATSSTLAYLLCRPLMESTLLNAKPGSEAAKKGLEQDIDYLCAMGTFGDLGTAFSFSSPWPHEDMKRCMKKWGKKNLTDAVSLLNAPRRTATYDVSSAWDALQKLTPREILSNPRLKAARIEVNNEINRCARNRPYFSGDGRVALIRVTSGAQIHPVIATRWTSSLKSSKLDIVMCANDGYLPGMVNFSCRVAKCAKERSVGDDNGVNVIELLTEYASKDPGLLEAMGDDFARGHREASGGIVRADSFERLWDIMQNVASPTKDDSHRQAKARKKQKIESEQTNTLDGWVKKSAHHDRKEQLSM